jgi:hypothetical protein
MEGWMKEVLSLQEQVLVLCLNDETGKFQGNWVDYGINGAALADLLLRTRIHLDAKTGVAVDDPAPLDDDLLMRALNRLAESKRPGRLSGWVATLYRGRPTARQHLLDRLIDRGVLTTQEGRVLWIFPRTLYPTQDPVPETAVRDRLRAALMGEGAVEPAIAVLAAILRACRALGNALTKAELKQQKQRIAAVCEADPVAKSIGKAVSDAISAAEAAASSGAIAAVSSTMAY